MLRDFNSDPGNSIANQIVFTHIIILDSVIHGAHGPALPWNGSASLFTPLDSCTTRIDGESCCFFAGPQITPFSRGLFKAEGLGRTHKDEGSKAYCGKCREAVEWPPEARLCLIRR